MQRWSREKIVFVFSNQNKNKTKLADEKGQHFGTKKEKGGMEKKVKKCCGRKIVLSLIDEKGKRSLRNYKKGRKM